MSEFSSIVNLVQLVLSQAIAWLAALAHDPVSLMNVALALIRLARFLASTYRPRWVWLCNLALAVARVVDAVARGE